MLVECKKAHDIKDMVCVRFVDSKCLPVVWFECTVNSDIYLSAFLYDRVWENIKNVATRRQYKLKQDGNGCHATRECLEFLRLKLGDRIISRNTEHIWSPYSPDLSPVDFSFCNEAMNFVEKKQVKTNPELKRTHN